METYSVKVTKDYLVFCCAHFISYENTKCERLHGHNYRAAAEVFGPLDENSLVVDFIALKRMMREITDTIDHRILLPRENPVLRVEEREDEVVVTHVVTHLDRKRWVFPSEDCVILPIANTTAELLARWIGERLREKLAAAGVSAISRLVIEVEESPGQSARLDTTPP